MDKVYALQEAVEWLKAKIKDLEDEKRAATEAWTLVVKREETLIKDLREDIRILWKHNAFLKEKIYDLITR